MKTLRLSTLGALVGLALANPSVAQEASTSKKAQKDPNEIVCEKQKVLGSRLVAKKVCLTRAQWAEQQRSDRQMVDKAQTQRSLNGQ